MPYDFRETFPYPTEEALREGFLARQGVDRWSEAEAMAFHDEVVRMLVAFLYIVCTLAEYRRRGLDPKTGSRGRTREKREEAAKKSMQEIQRIGCICKATLTQYSAIFGYEAEEDLRAHVVARVRIVKREQDAVEPNGQQKFAWSA